MAKGDVRYLSAPNGPNTNDGDVCGDGTAQTTEMDVSDVPDVLHVPDVLCKGPSEAAEDPIVGRGMEFALVRRPHARMIISFIPNPNTIGQ